MLAYGDEIATVRTSLVLAGITTLVGNDLNGRIATWRQNLPDTNLPNTNLPNTNLPNTSYKNYITSLGQHIGLPSQNMDLTPSPEVAWWFASHSWKGVYQSGEGVIYRISRSALEIALHEINQQPQNQGHPSAFELIDIGSGAHAVPDELTPRPVAQEGLTLAGGEVGEILLNLILNTGITAYVFQRDHTAHPRNMTEIKPLPDRLEHFIKQAKTGAWNVL